MQPHARPALPTICPGYVCALLDVQPFYICKVLFCRYLDGVRFFTVNPRNLTRDGSGWYSGGPKAGPYSPFDKPFHLIINLALGGEFTQEPWGTTVLREQVGSARPGFKLLQSSKGFLRSWQTSASPWCC
jgi:hypothetical protein